MKDTEASPFESEPDVPEVIFHALAAIIPRLTTVLREECDLTPIELLIIWHIRHFGQTNAEDDTVISRASLTEMLGMKFGKGAPDITRLIDGLQDKQLLRRVTLTSGESQTLGSKRRSVVILNQNGKQRLERFKSAIRNHAIGRYKELSLAEKMVIKTIRPIAVRIAKSIVARYEPHRMSLLYGESRTDPDEGSGEPGAPGSEL